MELRKCSMDYGFGPIQKHKDCMCFWCIISNLFKLCQSFTTDTIRSLSPPALIATVLCSESKDSFLFGHFISFFLFLYIFNMSEFMKFFSLLQAYFTYYNLLYFHLCCCKKQEFVFFNSCVYILYFLCLLICHWA